MLDNYKEFKFSYSYNLAGFLRAKVFKNKKEDYLADYFDVLDNDFRSKALKPKKQTVLHDYIKKELELEIEYLARKGDPDTLSEEWEELLTDYSINFSKSKVDVSLEEDYIDYLESKINDHLLDKIANETFHILFSDRMFCLKFNSIIAENIKELKKDDFPDFLKENGKVIRCPNFPEWVKRAILFRDRGSCAVCLKELSGVLRINESREKAIDHIVPLNLGGINDICNFQLICQNCNSKKLGHTIITSDRYPMYF
jgi:hypothetical protein